MQTGANTLTLPYAGAIRIRFEGLPDQASGSQSAKTDTPSMEKPLTKGLHQVKLWTRLAVMNPIKLGMRRPPNLSDLKCDAGVTDDISHGPRVAGMAMLQQPRPSCAQRGSGVEHDHCRQYATHSDVSFPNDTQKPARI
jgi:hypothetical protein